MNLLLGSAAIDTFIMICFTIFTTMSLLLLLLLRHEAQGLLCPATSQPEDQAAMYY